MAKLKVTLFRGYKEDHRISMEVYSDDLSRALRANFAELCEAREFQPHMPAWLGVGNWGMRLSRFGTYPWQARRHQGHVNHILDHGYGHLLYVLDPQRTVVTVHDLIPLLHWRGVIPGLSPGRRPLLNLNSFKALRRAKYLIADSENTRQDLIRFSHCAPEKIRVVYPGVDPIFRPYCPAEKEQARLTFGLPKDGTSRVLITGSQFYKNQTGALKVFARLLAVYPKPLQLLKIGTLDPEWPQSVQQFGLTKTAHCLGIVPRAQLPSLYNIVDCLLFPSLYEGFGWPPVEAMACGTPVVASNAASLPEVIGDAGLMCKPDDEEGLAQAIYGILVNEDLRRSLIARGLAWARHFTWSKTAQKTLEVYERIITR